MSTVRVLVDPKNVLARGFTQLEREQLPFVAVQAANHTAFAVRRRWEGAMKQVFDRPTGLTMKSALYEKATKSNPVARIFIRDEASKGASPAKYLQAEVEGGVRRHKGFERRLIAAGVMTSREYAMPGKGAELDGYGNMRSGQISKILSQLGARFDRTQNESAVSRKRRRGREGRAGQRRGDYFAVTVAGRKGLRPGVYQRVSTGFGSGVRSILYFATSANYRVRFNIFGLAQGIYEQEYPFHFERELAKAVQTSMFRGRA